MTLQIGNKEPKYAISSQKDVIFLKHQGSILGSTLFNIFIADLFLKIGHIVNDSLYNETQNHYDIIHRRDLMYYLLIRFIIVAKVSHIQVEKFGIIIRQRLKKLILFTVSKSQKLGCSRLSLQALQNVGQRSVFNIKFAGS